jgi:signal transduction histidine kinase
MKANFVYSFLSNNYRFSSKEPDFRKTYLINLVLLLVILSLLMFSIIDITVFYIPILAFANFLTFICSVFILYSFHRTDNTKMAAWTTVIIVFVAILFFIHYIAPKFYIIYWSVVIPPVAFFLLGKKNGYLISLAFAIIMVIYFISRFKFWGHDEFGLESIFNIGVAYTGLVLLIALFETSRQKAFDRMIRDLERRKIVEQDLKENETRLYNLNTTKDKFFSIIAHDLRGPLSTLIEATQLISDESVKLSEKEREDLLKHLNISAHNSFSLLENLLEWSQVQRELMKFKPQMLNLKNLVTESIKIIVEAARAKSIELITNIPDDLYIYADNHMLQTIIRNTISNSIKFTHEGGIVAISAHHENTNIIISVKDNGIGMNDYLLKNLFRIDVDTKRQGTNGEQTTGLGLLLCKEFIDKHKGKITVESEPQKGSLFRFSIPSPILSTIKDTEFDNMYSENCI